MSRLAFPADVSDCHPAIAGDKTWRKSAYVLQELLK
jgi:hypothetical protein